MEGEDFKDFISYLLEFMSFENVTLYDTPNLFKRTKETVLTIQETCDSIGVRLVYCKQTDDATGYGMFFTSLKKRFRVVITTEAVSPHTAYYIATALGAPQMHAVWLMMAASGEIPAKILQARPPQFVTAQRQAVDEVYPLATGYPRIQAPKIVYDQEEPRRSSVPCDMEEKTLSFARIN